MENISSSNGLEKCPKLRFPHFSGQWSDISFGELFTYISNNTMSRAELNYEVGDYKNIHYGDVLIKFGPILDVTIEKLPFITECTDKKNKNIVLRDGDVIIADTAEDETVGKAIEIINVGVQKVVSGLHTIACRPQIEMEPTYLGFYINSEMYHRQLYSLMQGVKVLSISKSNIENTIVRYPQRTEQKKICLLLNLIEAKIKKQYELIEHLKKYKRGFLTSLLEQKIHVSIDNEEWRECRIGDTLQILHGKDYKEFQAPHGQYPVLGTGGTIDYANRALCNWACVLIGRKGTIDKPQFMDKPFWTVDTLFYSKPKQHHDPKFQYYLFQTINWKRYNEASGVPSLSASTIEGIPVIVPNIRTQKKIANIFTQIDKLIEYQNSIFEQLLHVKRGLLQQLFI